MGGVSERGKLNDAFVFDIEVEQMQKVEQEELMKFRSYNNSCATAIGKTVVALVYGQEEFKRDMLSSSSESSSYTSEEENKVSEALWWFK